MRKQVRNNRAAGRASCWLIGGLGCLGVAVIGVIALVLMSRSLVNTLGKPIEEVVSKAQVVVSVQRAAYDALQQYAAANNGKYPKSLKELTPKYATEDLTRPIRLSDGSEVRLLYKPPQQGTTPDTVILEHKPPIKSQMEILGQKVDMEFTYQVQLNGEVYQQQVIIDPEGNKQTQRQRFRR
ncbi:MAG: hypothetical protein KatS3mg019_0138 [Fimbriimonadales bacterium]|nr:MAG: hypothetical protein KatS3mg019_0138 [Fimbriimonadales bacterium]